LSLAICRHDPNTCKRHNPPLTQAADRITWKSPAMPKSHRRTILHSAKQLVGAMMRAAALVLVTCTGAVSAQDAISVPAEPPPDAGPAGVTSESEQVDLVIDFAVILRIAGDVSVIVLGNSDIADASIVAGGTIALTGKAVGSTNIIVLGQDGDVLSEFQVQVAAYKPGTVTVRRALSPSSYACTGSSCQLFDSGPEAAPSQ